MVSPPSLAKRSNADDVRRYPRSVTSRPDDRHRIHRQVVSYVRRSARMNPSQEKAWAAHAGRLVVEVPRGERSTSIREDAGVDWAAAFGREAPLMIEIGSGRGEALAALAASHPDANVVAFEVFQPAVASALSLLAREGIDNVRIVLADGVEGLRRLVEPGELAQLWTFFPDPWHKARHHKRRLVDAATARLVASRLAPGAHWRLATDWEDYAQAMREVLDAAPGLSPAPDADAEGWAPRYRARPVTKYEARGLAAGRLIHDLDYVRTDEPVAPPHEEASAPVGDLVHRTPLPHPRGDEPL